MGSGNYYDRVKSKHWIFISALLGFLGVALGAFGAHALKETLETAGTVEVWKTGIHYLQFQAVALLVVASFLPAPSLRAIGGFWLVGILLFSGSLFGLALQGPPWLGPVTPLGGILLLVGWIWLAISALRMKTSPS